jgi:peptidoglycan/xylan/chitin deacetylase (PgdA/CDA1 family)
VISVRVGLTVALLALVIAVAARAAVPYEGQVVERGESESAVALTFDEPLGANTRPILRILERHGATATFFQLGTEVRRNEGLAAAIVRRGHELASHGWHHRDHTQIKDPRKSLRRTQRTAVNVSGVEPTLFRPPEGQYDERLIRIANRQGMTFVRWSLAAMDWTLPPDWIEAWVTDNIEPGDIVLFHQVDHSRNALPGIMRWLKEQGWEAVTVSELLG